LNGFTRSVIVMLAVWPSGRLAAQGPLNQFSYENLRFSGIQADLGVLGASHLTGAVAGGLRIDYGRIAPRVRVLLGVSYFRSQFDQETRTRFEQRIRSLVIDPSGDDTVRVGRIYWGDVSGDVDFQYVLPQGSKATAYLGLGVGIHVRNGSGQAINGTFVEDALDVISAGLNGTIGLEFHLSPAWRFALDGRGTLSSGLNTASLRGGLMYRLRAGREQGAGGAGGR
jgi:hypothetical protein